MAAERALPPGGLYALTPELADTQRLMGVVAACLEGGAAMVQYRVKSADRALAFEQATGVRALCVEHGIPFIVNDSLELALAVGADGLHLGREDGDVRAARRAMPGAILGVSCYGDAELARAAAEAGADYVGIGSIFPSTTKPGAGRAPLERLAEARAASGLPVVAIGGINAGNAAAAIAAGASFVAVIDAVFGAPDVREAARRIASRFPFSVHRHAQP